MLIPDVLWMTVIYNKGNSLCQICYFCVVGYFAKDSNERIIAECPATFLAPGQCATFCILCHHLFIFYIDWLTIESVISSVCLNIIQTGIPLVPFPYFMSAVSGFLQFFCYGNFFKWKTSNIKWVVGTGTYTCVDLSVSLMHESMWFLC